MKQRPRMLICNLIAIYVVVDLSGYIYVTTQVASSSKRQSSITGTCQAGALATLIGKLIKWRVVSKPAILARQNCHVIIWSIYTTKLDVWAILLAESCELNVIHSLAINIASMRYIVVILVYLLRLFIPFYE